jgi:thymidylate synthase (FAD)
MIKSTWADEPIDVTDDDDDRPEIRETFMNLLTGKVLPNSMEHLLFTFRIEGLTLIEVTHMLRHRTMSSVHAQCTADRFLHHDSAFIPQSILNSKFADRYKELTESCKELYAEMVDSKDISLLDARYILTRNHRYFYYFTMNLKDAMMFINQRKCTQIQPELDNVIAHLVHRCISHIVPEFAQVVSLDCGPSCFYVKAPDEDNSRLYKPDEVHARYVRTDFTTLYDKTRKEMGAGFNPQDK